VLLVSAGLLTLVGCTATGTSTSSTAPPTSTAAASMSVRASTSTDPTASINEALLDAAARNDVDTARRLIGQGADVNHANARSETTFLIATSEVGDDPTLLDLAIAAGGDIQARDSFNGTGLIRAAERGFPTITARLLDAGLEVDHVNNLGWTALHEAIILGDGSEPYVQVVQLLVDRGADVRLRSRTDGVTPIEHAEVRGFTEIADILRRTERGMNPDERLLDAARTGSVVAVDAALNAGADIEAKDAHQRTALLRAAAADNVDVAQLLVTRGADVNALDYQHDTPFLVTGVTGSVAMLRALLPGSPDTRIRNRFGGVAVIPASERGHVDYVRAVLETTDIDVNHVNDLGWTALLEAVILGDGGPAHQDIVRILLEHGADASIADNDGVTPLRNAENRGFTEIAEILRSHSTDR
jgi:ankyrin repeat protein